MAGIKGRSGRASKLVEYNYQISVIESDKRYLEACDILNKTIHEKTLAWVLENDPWKKLYYKLLEVGRDYVMKAMPTRLEGEGVAPNIQVIFERRDAKDTIQASRFATPSIQ